VVHVAGSHIRNSMLLAPHVESLAAEVMTDLAGNPAVER
jgi:hypothetical protein